MSPAGIILSLGCELLQLPDTRLSNSDWGFAYIYAHMTRLADLISPDSRAASCEKYLDLSVRSTSNANYRSGATAVIAAIIAASGFVCHIIYPPVMSRLNCSSWGLVWPCNIFDLRFQNSDRPSLGSPRSQIHLIWSKLERQLQLQLQSACVIESSQLILRQFVLGKSMRHG